MPCFPTLTAQLSTFSPASTHLSPLRSRSPTLHFSLFRRSFLLVSEKRQAAQTPPGLANKRPPILPAGSWPDISSKRPPSRMHNQILEPAGYVLRTDLGLPPPPAPQLPLANQTKNERAANGRIREIPRKTNRARMRTDRKSTRLNS